MSVIHIHHDGLTAGSAISRAFVWLGAAFTAMHQAIVTAKLERLEHELVVRRGYGDDGLVCHEAARYPQRPLVLGEKWDF
jgi:hypothetical protein